MDFRLERLCWKSAFSEREFFFFLPINIEAWNDAISLYHVLFYIIVFFCCFLDPDCKELFDISSGMQYAFLSACFTKAVSKVNVYLADTFSTNTGSDLQVQPEVRVFIFQWTQ